MEARRLSAGAQLSGGARQSTVARLYEVSRTTASRWARALKRAESLARRKAPGRPPKLTREQMELVYLAGPVSTPRWSCLTLAAAINERFGVSYDADHVGRILRQFRDAAKARGEAAK